MQSLLKRSGASWFFSATSVAGLSIFILAVGVLMQPAAEKVGQERMSELVCFQLAFVPNKAAEILASFPVDGQAGIGELLIPGDFALAWGYGLVLFGLLGLMTMRLPDNWQRPGGKLIYAPLCASVLDCIENIFLVLIVRQFLAGPDVPLDPLLPALAGTASVLKWIALSVVTPVFGLAGIGKGIATDRRLSSWIVYGLLLVVLISMIMKPIQDIPACF